MNAVVCTVRYGRQFAASITQLISSPDGMLHCRIHNWDSMLHELHVAGAFLLMVTRLGSTWVGKVSPFCLAWLVNSTMNAMSSIEEIFGGIVWLFAIIDDALYYKIRLLQIELLIFWTTIPTLFFVSISNGCPGLCGCSFKKLRTSWHGVHCSFLMGSARAKGSTIAEHCEAPGTTVSSPLLAITRQLSHYIGSTRWFIPQQVTKHIFVHKCLKLVKLVATP